MKRTAKGWQGCSEVACKVIIVVVVIMLMLDLMKRTVQKAARQLVQILIHLYQNIYMDHVGLLNHVSSKGFQNHNYQPHPQASSQDPGCTKTKEGSKKLAIENSQKEEVVLELEQKEVMGHELEGSDSEASCNTGFKIPDVPKPNTGADDVADWAAEVILTRMTLICTMMILRMTLTTMMIMKITMMIMKMTMPMMIRCVQACGNCDKGWTVF